MASSWASSWLSSWGVSWGGVAPPSPPASPAVGGGSAKRRRRHYVIGDKHVIVDDRTDIETVVAALAQSEPAIEPAKVVRKREPVPAAEIAPVPVEFVPLAIDWGAIDALLRQSIRLDQPEVVAVLRELRKRLEDDEDDVESMMLLI